MTKDFSAEFSRNLEEFAHDISREELNPDVAKAFSPAHINGKPAVSLLNVAFMLGTKLSELQENVSNSLQSDLDPMFQANFGSSRVILNGEGVIINKGKRPTRHGEVPLVQIRLFMDHHVPDVVITPTEEQQKTSDESTNIVKAEHPDVDERQRGGIERSYIALYYFSDEEGIHPQGISIGLFEQKLKRGINIEIGVRRILMKARNNLVDKALIQNFVTIEDLQRLIGPYVGTTVESKVDSKKLPAHTN